jgi:hypothetical protein
MEAELLAAASALERHVASNPANGRTVLITAKRAANYPDLTGMGLAFRQCAQTPGLPIECNDFERTRVEVVLPGSRQPWSHQGGSTPGRR